MSRRGKAAGLLLTLTAFFLICGFAKPNQGYLKSATYYSDDWMVNFWNGESDDMDAELRQIAGDGFNNIILVLPWREFQPENGSFNSYAIERLHKVMNAAEAQQLSVMLRVGYTWDYYPEGKSAVVRVNELPYSSFTRKQWFSYLSRIYSEASAHANFAGGFATWEDFWTFTSTATSYGKNKKGIENAEKSGFRDYALAHYSIEELREIYKDQGLTEDTIYFPSKANYALKIFYDWYDAFLMELIADSQQFFPDLSFEIRLDGDRVLRNDGSTEWYMHQNSFRSLRSSYASAMYGVPMFIGGGRVSAGRALQGTQQALAFAASSGKPVYVEQLLFTESTPGYEDMAKIHPEEEPAYLLSLPGLLRSMTNGYGIWVYRDYGNNKLFNPQFGLRERGWKLENNARVEQRAGSNAARLAKGGKLSQQLEASAGTQNGRDTTVRFRLSGDGKVTVRFGSAAYSFPAKSREWETVQHLFSGNSGVLSFECTDGYVYIDNVNAYNLVTEGHLYHLDGSEDYCIPAIRTLNSQLG